MLHQSGLFLHMIGIILVGGGSIGSILAETQLWKKIQDRSAEEAKAYLPILGSATFFIYAGMIVFILSGLIMLYSVNWVYFREPWFIAKLVLFLMLPIRGAVIGKATVLRIARQVNEEPGNLPALMALKSKMQRFHTIQYILVAAIIFLVVFKI